MARSPAKTPPTTEDLASQIDDLKEDLSTITVTLTELTKAKRDEAIRTAKLQTKKLKNAAEEQVDDLSNYAGELQGYMEDKVREQPAMSLGVAAGLGFLAGMIMVKR